MEILGTDDKNDVVGDKAVSPKRDASRYAIIDVEVGLKDNKIHDIGALRNDGATFHNSSRNALFEFIGNVDYICGHNIIHHDAKYLFASSPCRWALVDTLYVSPLLFPERPYHKLVKDDKLMSDQINNPVNDCEKARDLLSDEVAHWNALPEAKRKIWLDKLPWLGEQAAWRLAESYNFSGGEIDNIVRKATMMEVLDGTAPSVEAIDRLCVGEKIARNQQGSPRIGFR